MNNFNLMFSNFKETLKVNSPKIKLGVGLATGGATIFLACKATLKVNQIMDEFNKKLEEAETSNIKALYANNEEHQIKVSENVKKKMVFNIYKETFIKLLKLYSPAIGTGAVSLVFIISSFNELNTRLNSASAAAASILAAYNGLKEKFIEKYGEDEFENLLNDDSTALIVEDEEIVKEHPRTGIKTARWPFTIKLVEGESTIWPKGMPPETLISQLVNINATCISDACLRYERKSKFLALSAERIADYLGYNPVSPAEAFYFTSYGKVYNPKNPLDDFITWNKDSQSYEEFLKGSGIIWVTINVDPDPRF